MTCQECELALAGDERGVDEHLAVCSACREFAAELRENSVAMTAFALDAMPSVGVVRARRPLFVWGAVAAMLVVGFASALVMRSSRQVQPAISSLALSTPGPESTASTQQAEAPVPHRASRTASARQAEPPVPRKKRQADPASQGILQVKMLTDDPDVVIYWQVSN